MIAFLLGDYKHAVELSQEFELSRKRKSLGGRYVYALSKLGLGEPGPAQKAAALWELSYEPEEVFLAASLYLALAQEYEAVGRCKEATEKYRKVVETLTNEQRRLHRDYTLGGATDIFGNHIASVPLRFDLFGQFAFGLMDAFSYAPQGNVYVSYALAKSELKTGQVHAARKRYDEIRGFKGIRTYRDIQSRALSDEARISRCDDSISDAPN
jgi:tetratricopeptide (TPR) repeat protein